MEGAPLTPAETPDSGRFDSDADKQDKSKKKKKTASIISSHSEQANISNGERRIAARDTLANLSLGSAFSGRSTTEKPKKQNAEVSRDDTLQAVEHVDADSGVLEQHTEPNSTSVTEKVSYDDAAVVELAENDDAASFTEDNSSPAIEQAYRDVLEQYAQQTVSQETSSPVENIVASPEGDVSEQIEAVHDLAEGSDMEDTGMQTEEFQLADFAPAPDVVDEPQQDLDENSTSNINTTASNAPTTPALPRSPIVLPLNRNVTLPNSVVRPMMPPIPPSVQYNAAAMGSSDPSVHNSPVPNANLTHNVSKSVVEHRIVEKSGGFGTALALASLYGHFKLKKRARNLENNLAKTNKLAAELQKNHTQKINEVERLVRVTSLNTAVERTSTGESAVPTAYKTERLRTIEHVDSTQPIRQEQPRVTRMDSGVRHESMLDSQAIKAGNPEGANVTAPIVEKRYAHERLDIINQPHTANSEKLSAPIIVEDEPVVVPSDRRVETSSWHRIEIDKATGKAVEDPTIAYGEAFQQERHQELRVQADNSSVDINSTEHSDSTSAGGSPGLNSAASTHLFGGITNSNTTASQSVQQSNQIEETKRIADAKKINNASIGLWAVFVTLVAATVFVFFS